MSATNVLAFFINRRRQRGEWGEQTVESQVIVLWLKSWAPCSVSDTGAAWTLWILEWGLMTCGQQLRSLEHGEAKRSQTVRGTQRWALMKSWRDWIQQHSIWKCRSEETPFIQQLCFCSPGITCGWCSLFISRAELAPFVAVRGKSIGNRADAFLRLIICRTSWRRGYM